MEEQCCVCLENPKYPIKLKCGHTFCFLCIKFVNETSNCCPLCRSTITETFDDVDLNDITSHEHESEYPCVKWLFGSRDEKSWWYYDDETSQQIEQYYQNQNTDTEPKINIGRFDYHS